MKFLKIQYLVVQLATVGALTAAITSQPAAAADVSVSTKGGVNVTAGEYNFKVGGRIMYDYNKSEKNGITDEDGFDLRRGRVYVSGNIAEDWAYKVQFNVDGSGAEDLYLRYTGWGKAANVTVGKQKVPFGLELLESSKDISILERSALTERYAEGRAEGVQVHGQLANNSTYGIALFARDVDDSNDDEIGVAARYTIAPIVEDNRVLHFGVAYKDIADNQALGLEAAMTSGPFHVQAEYFDGEEGSNDDLSGYYIQAGYFFTGETRPYSKGIFKRPSPNAKGGAWEAVVRLEDGDGSHGDIELGDTDATAYTVGLNWYAHKNVRLGVNYTEGDDNNDEDDGSEFRVRFQLTF